MVPMGQESVFIDTALFTTIECFCGAPFTDVLPTPIATSHHFRDSDVQKRTP